MGNTKTAQNSMHIVEHELAATLEITITLQEYSKISTLDSVMANVMANTFFTQEDMLQNVQQFCNDVKKFNFLPHLNLRVENLQLVTGRLQNAKLEAKVLVKDAPPLILIPNKFIFDRDGQLFEESSLSGDFCYDATLCLPKYQQQVEVHMAYDRQMVLTKDEILLHVPFEYLLDFFEFNGHAHPFMHDILQCSEKPTTQIRLVKEIANKLVTAHCNFYLDAPACHFTFNSITYGQVKGFSGYLCGTDQDGITLAINMSNLKCSVHGKDVPYQTAHTYMHKYGDEKMLQYFAQVLNPEACKYEIRITSAHISNGVLVADTNWYFGATGASKCIKFQGSHYEFPIPLHIRTTMHESLTHAIYLRESDNEPIFTHHSERKMVSKARQSWYVPLSATLIQLKVSCPELLLAGFTHASYIAMTKDLELVLGGTSSDKQHDFVMLINYSSNTGECIVDNQHLRIFVEHVHALPYVLWSSNRTQYCDLKFVVHSQML